MTRTAWHQEDLHGNVARHFDNSGTRTKPRWRCRNAYCYADYPSGQLHMSANDLATYLELMLNKGKTKWGARVVEEAMFARTVRCQGHDKQAAALSAKKCNYGFLWALLQSQTAKADFQDVLVPKLGNWDELKDGFSHDGSDLGSQSEFIVLPSKGVAIGFVSNTESLDKENLYDSVAVLKDLVDIMPNSDPDERDTRTTDMRRPTPKPLTRPAKPTTRPLTKAKTRQSPTTANRGPPSSTCSKCVWNAQASIRTCCARGGAWFENCGEAGDKRFDHTWLEGSQACSGKSGDTDATPTCSKCGTFKKNGVRSCCARGGAWLGDCGNENDSKFTWFEGLQACKSNSVHR